MTMRKRKGKLTALAKEDVDHLLRDWVALNKDVMSLPIEAVYQLLVEEVKRNSNKRPQVLLRLFGRYNRLREGREKQILLRGILPW